MLRNGPYLFISLLVSVFLVNLDWLITSQCFSPAATEMDQVSEGQILFLSVNNQSVREFRALTHCGPIPMTCESCSCRKHNNLGDRSFSAAGPRLWNNLPPGLWRPGLTFDSFTKSLKSHLFGNQSA